MGVWVDVLVYEKNLTITSDIEGPPERDLPLFSHYAVFSRDFFSRIAENRIVKVQRFCKFCVGLDGVAACGEVGDIVLSDLTAAVTQRLAFLRSTAGESFWEPCQHHDFLLFEIGEGILLAVGAGERKRGGFIFHGYVLFYRACQDRQSDDPGERECYGYLVQDSDHLAC